MSYKRSTDDSWPRRLTKHFEEEFPLLGARLVGGLAVVEASVNLTDVADGEHAPPPFQLAQNVLIRRLQLLAFPAQKWNCMSNSGWIKLNNQTKLFVLWNGLLQIHLLVNGWMRPPAHPPFKILHLCFSNSVTQRDLPPLLRQRVSVVKADVYWLHLAAGCSPYLWCGIQRW